LWSAEFQGVVLMPADAESPDSLYRQGVQYFNDCEFFEAHDTWEE
jgi:hypothetical protein